MSERLILNTYPIWHFRNERLKPETSKIDIIWIESTSAVVVGGAWVKKQFEFRLCRLVTFAVIVKIMKLGRSPSLIIIYWKKHKNEAIWMPQYSTQKSNGKYLDPRQYYLKRTIKFKVRMYTHPPFTWSAPAIFKASLLKDILY